MVTATQINYYHVCWRELWLSANQIQMEHNSELVTMGRQIHEFSYPQRSEKYTEVALEGIKIDYFDAVNKVVHEIKKSDKLEPAHIAQLKYYLYVLENHGVEGVTGVLEYPKLRHKQTVILTDDDRRAIPQWVADIERIISLPTCPPLVPKSFCKTCSYYDLCYAGEL